MWVRKYRLRLIVALVVLCGIAVWVIADAAGEPPPRPPAAAVADAVIPAPVHVVHAADVTFTLPGSATIASDAPDIGDYLAGILRTSTGFAIPTSAGTATIELRLSGAPSVVGDEGYGLTVTGDSVVVRARKAAGLFAGVQTLLQLLPPAVQGKVVAAGPWTIPGQTIVDLAYGPAVRPTPDKDAFGDDIDVASGPLWSALDGSGSDAFAFPPTTSTLNYVAAFLLFDPQRMRAGVSGHTGSCPNPMTQSLRIGCSFGIGHAHEFTHAFAQVIRRTVGRWVNTQHRRRPMIVPVVIEA